MSEERLNALQLGEFVYSTPLPHDEANTLLYPAGPITIGVEYRVFDPAVERQRLTQEEIDATGSDSLFSRDEIDQGVCLHIFSTDGFDEYLRFDCFSDEPHYHYIVPPVGNVLVHYDTVAGGDMLEWALETIRHRLRDMLAVVSADDLASAIDQDALSAALDEAAAAARQKRGGVSV